MTDVDRPRPSPRHARPPSPSSSTSDAGPLVLSSPPTWAELHTGFMLGRLNPGLPYPAWGRSADPTADPRRSLEDAIRPALLGGNCLVQFSGGRDSSLILAVAVHVARREGLALPGAVSVRYPGDALSEEAGWQELVTGHLGVELEVLTVPAGGNDIAGELAVSRLRRDGAVLPPVAGVNLGRLSTVAAGRRVLTGEGGDNILGTKKVSRWRAHARRRRLPAGEFRRLMAEDIAPRPLRRELSRRRLLAAGYAYWLRPQTQREFVAAMADDACTEPWDWRKATWDFLNYRICSGYEAMRLIAARDGFSVEHPLMAAGFVEALCRRAGPLGFSGRTKVMRFLAADLLPESLLSRASKASFNGAYAGDQVRDFARGWDGSGVDPELVDVEQLRTAWTSPIIPALSLSPLQLALSTALQQGWEPRPAGESSP